jgi:hypothetical protein
MKVNSINPTANAAYKKPRCFASLSQGKTTIIDGQDKHKPFDDAKSAWEYKVRIEA